MKKKYLIIIIVTIILIAIVSVSIFAILKIKKNNKDIEDTKIVNANDVKEGDITNKTASQEENTEIIKENETTNTIENAVSEENTQELNENKSENKTTSNKSNSSSMKKESSNVSSSNSSSSEDIGVLDVAPGTTWNTNLYYGGEIESNGGYWQYGDTINVN